MRYAIILATSLVFAGSALAGDAPTKAQCDAGWKADYSKMWTQANFEKACSTMKK